MCSVILISDGIAGEAIVLESALISLKPPASRILEAYRNVFHNVASSGGGYPTLGGRSSEILDNVDDLMSLHKPLEEDRLTKWLRYYLPILFVVSLDCRIPMIILNLY